MEMKNKRDQRLGVSLILGVLLLLALLFSIVKIATDTQGEPSNLPNPSTDFGNNTIGGCIVGDAQLITNDGNRVQTNPDVFTVQAQPPSIIVNSTFDTGLDGWSATNTVHDTNQGYFLSDGSVRMQPSTSQVASLSQTIAESISEDTYKIVFWVNLSEGVSTSEYFILRVQFNGGNELVYLLNGSYTAAANERKIDVTVDLDRTNAWNGFNLVGIEEDYKSQFSVTSVPDFIGLEFEYSRASGNAIINIDEFMFIRVPIPTDGYWIDDDNTHVIYATVQVQWNVTISDNVNASNVWLKLELELQIENATFQPILAWQLAQVDLFQVNVFNTTSTWMSRTIGLPIDDTIYGDELNYNWTIRAEAYGEIENSTMWVTANGELESFDTFRIRWFDGQGEITVELYVVVGSFGALGVLGAIGVKKSKQTNASMYN